LGALLDAPTDRLVVWLGHSRAELGQTARTTRRRTAWRNLEHPNALPGRQILQILLDKSAHLATDSRAASLVQAGRFQIVQVFDHNQRSADGFGLLDRAARCQPDHLAIEPAHVVSHSLALLRQHAHDRLPTWVHAPTMPGLTFLQTLQVNQAGVDVLVVLAHQMVVLVQARTRWLAENAHLW